MEMNEYRICPNCEHKNSPSSLQCEKCEFDLSFEKITKKSDLQEKGQNNPLSSGIRIEAKDDKKVSLNIETECLIGREEMLADYFNKSSFVSRQHAKLKVKDNQLYIVDCSTNGTFINGNRIKKLNEYPIKAGDEVTFGDITFIVKG